MEADVELWVCDKCSQIGSCAEAQEHEIESGHAVRRLTGEEAQGVREVWADEGRDPRNGRIDLGIIGTLLTEEGKRLARGIGSRLRGLGGPDY